MRTLPLALAGFAALALTLAAPSTSNAQTFYPRPYTTYQSTPVNNFSSYNGNLWYNGYPVTNYSPINPGYNSYYDWNRPVIVHPEYWHWSPRRGWHTHGHMHIPHRDHYHTRPY